MKHIFLALLIAVSVVSSAQAADDTWTKWSADARQAIHTKSDGIKTLSDMRDSACSVAKDAKPNLCVELYKTIIDRRAAERQQLSQMLLVAATLSAAERDRLLTVQIPAYQRMNDDTSVMSSQVTQMFPPLRQSSSR